MNLCPMVIWPDIPKEFLSLCISGRMGLIYWAETWEKWEDLYLDLSPNYVKYGWGVQSQAEKLENLG